MERTATAAYPGPLTREIVRRDTVLADGRELHYYDWAGTSRETPDDTRDLPPQPEPGQARFDPRTGDWVFIATHRQARIFLPTADQCPLCPSTPEFATEVPGSDYAVVVFANRFPALVGTGSGPIEPDGSLLPVEPATGQCEVICFDPRHELALVDLAPDQVRLVIEAWADRTEALAARPDVVQVFCFENRGEEIGVTQHHPHGQIYAYSLLAPRTARMIKRAADYRRQHASNLFDDLVTAETADGSRVVTSNKDWIAFVPFAAHWPFEVHLYPRVRVGNLAALAGGTRSALAGIYLDILGRFNRLFDRPMPYVAAWHQAPLGPGGVPKVPGAQEFALHLELFSNRRSATALKYVAGTEAGMDMFSNDIVPEDAARRLREAV